MGAILSFNDWSKVDKRHKELSNQDSSSEYSLEYQNLKGSIDSESKPSDYSSEISENYNKKCRDMIEESNTIAFDNFDFEFTEAYESIYIIGDIQNK